MRTLLLGSLLLVLSACGGASHSLPDGGHRPLSCRENEEVAVTVKVVDAAGNPVEGAEVVAKNEGTQLTQTSTTNAQGLTTAVTGELGEGTVRVVATQDSRASAPAQVRFTCGECGCVGDPANLTLTLPE